MTQRRLAMDAAGAIQEDVLLLAAVDWVDANAHGSGVSALLIAGHRDLRLVDCINLVGKRRLSIDTAFAFDCHFAQKGFATIP